MTAELLLVITVVAGLAWANGANDVSKGVATLVGGGVTSYRRAILWGALWTGVGSALAAVAAGAMLATFGHGLLSEGAAPSFASALAVLVGAAGWVLLATRTGLPVSTTHALVGALVGVALLAHGPGGVAWGALGGKVALPLLLAPAVALVLTGVILRAWPGREPDAAAKADCLCLDVASRTSAPARAYAGATHPAMNQSQLVVVIASSSSCATHARPGVRLTLSHLHWLTSGATSLARGMNDAPKIVALALAASALGGGALGAPALYVLVTVGMVAGSLIAGRRVTRALAEDVTPMSDRQGFAANLVTAALVTTGAIHGLPMSTTHVAAGGIFAAGAERRTLDWRVLRGILLAWVVTLPAAAALAAGAYALAKAFGA